MNNNEHLHAIYQKFLQNSATKQELDELFILLRESGESEIKNEIIAAMEHYQDAMLNSDAKNDILQVRAGLLQKISNEQIIPIHKRRAWMYAAACAAAVLTIAAWFVIVNSKQQDMLPGHYSAMLSVNGGPGVNPEQWANGKTQRVSGVMITKQANGNISFSTKETDTSALNHINTITTPKGGYYKVTLGDSTVVMLNSESSLQFPVAFTGGERRVKLKGEAWFDVTKNKHKPFIVSTGGQQVQVLGTRFDITNFEEDGGPITTLLEGSVKVSTATANALLKPGQQSKVAEGRIAVTDIDAEQYSAWKDGKFSFENVPLGVIMHKLSRWYNFETDYSKLPARNFYISISRYSKLSDVLRMITLSSGIRFKIDERRVIITQ